MATWRVNNSTLLGGEICAQWVPNHAYSLGARAVCRVAYGTQARRAYVYECTTAGTSHATTEPTWPTSGTVADNDIVWTARNPNDGDWNNASCILHYVLNHAAVAAGDFVYIDDGHSESLQNIRPYIILGSATVNNPVKIICVDKTADTLSTGAIVKNNDANDNFYFQRSIYSYGVTYDTVSNFGMSTSCICTLQGNGSTLLLNMSAASAKWIGPSNASVVLHILDGNVGLNNVGMYFAFQAHGYIRWVNGALVAPNGVTKLIDLLGAFPRNMDIICVDLSAVGSGATATSLLDNADDQINNILISRCKLPSAAGFTITTGALILPGNKPLRLHHCSSADKYYDFFEEAYEGSIQEETTIVRTGGASDGTTPQAWKMISSANALDNYRAMISPPITIWNAAASEKTFTIECLLDSATNPQNDEVWMELEYPADNTSGLGAVAKDKCAILSAAADKSAGVGAGGWTTTGLTNPNSFKCAVTVTPGKAGPVSARICLAKPSTTVYVDPLITIS